MKKLLLASFAAMILVLGTVATAVPGTAHRLRQAPRVTSSPNSGTTVPQRVRCASMG
jgi:hypothetical protein